MTAQPAPKPLPLAIRAAAADDLAAIQAIYAHHVRHGVASFEEEPPEVAEIERRWRDVRALGLPYLAATSDDRLVGYAYANLFRPRSAYRYTCEDSVYVAPGMEGRGIGRALLDILIAASTALGYRQMVAVIGTEAASGGTSASVRLHGRAGFVEAGKLPAVGFKLGRWVDIWLMQRPLGPGDGAPP